MTAMTSLRRMMLIPLLFSAIGCASVPMADSKRDEAAKKFTARPDMANVYVYRTSRFASAVKYPVALDGKLLGELPGKTFIVTTVPPGAHQIYVSGEKPEIQSFTAQAGKNHFVKVSPRMGWASARANVEIMNDEKEAMSDVDSCSLIEGL